MEKIIKRILYLFLMLMTILIIISFNLKVDATDLDENEVILYNQEVGSHTNAEMNEIWQSNNPRSWILTGTMDGEITKKYKMWENKYKSTVVETSNEKGLEDGTYLTITIPNLDIESSDYDDIRLNIDYISCPTPYATLIRVNSLEVYAIDSNNNKYGPFHLDDYETKGFYMRKSSATNTLFERNFNLITEKIDVPSNVRITELEIIPYGNYPLLKDDGKTLAGNWRGQDSTYFSVAAMKIIGYKNSNYKRPDYIKTKQINVNQVRENIVKRMYDMATIKWSPTVEFHDTRTVGSNPSSIRTTYLVGNTYYGPPYTQRNRGTLEKFASELDDNGLLAEPENLLDIWGNDCGTSVSYSISKYIPVHEVCGVTEAIWDRRKTTLLGNLQIDGKDSATTDLKSRYTEQEFYEAYAELQKGDMVSTHWKSNTHIRLITGNTHVVRNADGTINPDESYIIRTDIKITPADTSHGSNDFGGLINENDYVVPFEPKQEYTDIQSLSDLEGKNLNFYINRKETFKEAYNGNYLPITLNEYLTGTVEEPYARIINPNTAENIKNGLKGTIYTNYTIISINFNIHNKVTGEDKAFVDYPSHRTVKVDDISMSSLEGTWANTYSLYYNTPEEIQNYIRETMQDWNDFELKISVTAGENDNMEVFNLKYDKVAPELDVKYSTTLSTNQDIVVTITANEEIQEVEGWTLSEDKKTMTKTYTENKAENIEITDLAGNISTEIIDIKNIDKQKPIVEVKYSSTEKTLEDVIVTIEANEELQEVEGWQLSDDKKSLIKTYTKNDEETITIYDLAGNSIVETIKIENIDKEKPEYNVKYSTTLSTNEDVTVTITANEEIQSVEGWNLSEDKKILTKTYTENTEEEIIIKDLVGNSTSTTIIKISNIDKIKPEINISYSITEITNQDIIVTIIANEEIKEIEGWNLSTDKKELKKEFTSNTEENITISDLAGNTISDTIKISNVDKVAPKIEIKYSTTSATDKDVIVTITSDKIIRNIDGWTLSSDKKQLTKNFNENGEEEITITDEAGNSVTTKVKVSNIDKTESKQVDTTTIQNDDTKSISNNDTTTAKMILPNTGEKNILIFIVIFMILSTIMYIKFKKYKDVK